MMSPWYPVFTTHYYYFCHTVPFPIFDLLICPIIFFLLLRKLYTLVLSSPTFSSLVNPKHYLIKKGGFYQYAKIKKRKVKYPQKY